MTATPLFILGYSKSGTTLLTSLLDGHPDINVIPEESDYFDGIYFLVQRLIRNTRLSTDKKIRVVREAIKTSTHISNLFKGKRDDDPKGNFDYRGFDEAAFDDRFERVLHTHGLSHEGVFQALASAYMSGNNKNRSVKYWVEKTPFHKVNVRNRESLLDAIFADYKTLFIFRDPRDNYLAYSRKQPQLTIYDICYEWNRIADVALGWNAKDRCLILRYEDLVSDIESTLETIRTFLGLGDHENLYRPTKNGVPWLGNSMFGDKSARVSANRIDRYKTMLSPELRHIIELHCAPFMERLNYPFSSLDGRKHWQYHWAKLKATYVERRVSIRQGLLAPLYNHIDTKR